HLHGVFDPGAGQQPGGLDAVQDRHAHVHDDDVRAEPPGQLDRGAPVTALPGHGHVGLGVDDGRQAGADEGLVVADQDPDRRGHAGVPTGIRARTRKPPSSRRPASKSPPRTPTRSRRPARPRPLPPGVAAPAPFPSVPTSTVSALPPWRTRTEVRPPWWYLSAFVRASCTTR